MKDVHDRMPILRRHKLHYELKKSNPLMSLKERNKVLDCMEIRLFIKWLGDRLCHKCGYALNQFGEHGFWELIECRGRKK